MDKIEDLVRTCLNPPRELLMGDMDKDQCCVFLVCLFYSIWSARNEKWFEGKQYTYQAILRLNTYVHDFEHTKPSEECEWSNLSATHKTTCWRPPKTGWLKANVDAAFKEGRAAAAVVFRNWEGHLV